MIKIEPKNRILHTIAKIVCGLLVVVALFLLGISLIFAVSGGAPNIFGHNIYLVETDAFQLLHEGTAVFVKQEQMAQIAPGNIVIFDDGANGPQLGEVQMSDLVDGVYSFIVLNEANTAVQLTQSQIVGKATSYSDILGAIISFAVSPFGVLVLAIIPCLIIIGLEIYKATHKDSDRVESPPVNKQQEVPTYVPGSRRTAAFDDEPMSLDDMLEESEGRRTYDVQRRTPPEMLGRESRSRVIGSTGAVQRTATSTIPSARTATGTIPSTRTATGTIPSARTATGTIPSTRTATGTIPRATQYAGETSPLFLGPNAKPAPRKTDTMKMPLSQKALNDAIAESKAQREAAALNKERAELVKEIQKTRTSTIERERLEEEERRRMIAQKTEKAERMAARNAQQRNAQQKNAVGATGTVPKFNPVNRTAAIPRASMGMTREIPKVDETADDIVQQYIPTHRGTATRATTSLPRLDALLNDESENEDKRYNIDDILASLDKNV